MAQENKELLLKDLCARLPYGVILLSSNKKITYQTDGNTGAELLVEEGWKPYLRPMSSMTEDEKKELKELHFYYTDDHIINDEDNDFKPIIVDEVHYSCIIDWLNAHHFDYRGLIEKDLAIEAPNDMYKI